MTPTSAPYVGNQDFRGYLNYLAKNGDTNAQYAITGGNSGLGFVDNTGKIANDATLGQYLGGNTAADTASSVNNFKNYINSAYATYQSLNNPNRVGASSPGINPQFVNQSYDTKIAGLQGILDTLDPQQNSANLQVQNQYQDQANSLQTQNATGHRNLDLAQQQVDTQKAQSLDDLRRQVQTMGMSYANQLGAYGAGDSSAAGLIQQALSGQASRNRGQVMDSAAQQGQAIQLQGTDLDNEFNSNMKLLEDWKNSSLNDIATKFLQQRQTIQQQMQSANADRYQALAQLDSSYVNNAISQLAALEGQYRQSAQDLIAQYQNMKSPQVSIDPSLQQFAVNPISAGEIGNLKSVPQLASTGANPTPLAVRRPFEQDFGLSLFGA